MNNNIVREKEKSFTADSITSLTPTQAVKDTMVLRLKTVFLMYIQYSRQTPHKQHKRIIQETYRFIITKNSTDKKLMRYAAI